jgi:hypothetical protein
MAILIIVVLLVGNRSLLRGKAAPQWDAVSFFAPEFALLADHTKAGHLLLWDPLVAAGSPDFAEPEFGSTSPITLAVGAVFSSSQNGFVAYWMLIWVGAGIGVLLFTRYLGSPPWGSGIAALGFAASGFFVGHAQHTSSLFSVAFLPWICWRFDDALVNRRVWSAVEAGVLYGLSALGGYPQFTILTPGFLALWALGRILFPEHGRKGQVLTPALGTRRVLWVAGVLVLVGVIGGLVFSPPYSGMMSQTRGYSDRIGERPRDQSIGSNILPAGAITTLGNPYLFLLSYPGLPGRLWAFSDVSMSDIYSGAVVVVLAVLAVLSRSRWCYWLAFVALFFLCCSLGNQTPLRGWLYDYVVPTRYFRGASMFSAYTIFLLAVLSSLAARDLENEGTPKSKLARQLLVSAVVLSVLAAISFGIILHQATVHPFKFHLAIAHLILVWTAILVCAGLLYAGRLSGRSCGQVLLLIASLDALAAIFIAGPVMYSTATVPWWKVMTQKHVASLELTSQGLERRLHSPDDLAYQGVADNRNLLVKAPDLISYVTLANRFQLVSDMDPHLESFALGKERIWFSDQPVKVPPNDASFAAYKAVMDSSPLPPLIVHTPGQMVELAGSNIPSGPAGEETLVRSAPPVVPAHIELVQYLPNTLAFRYTANSDGWLLVTDRWATGWTAQVNGSPVEVFGANFLFRAVPVKRGENIIRFDYQPRGYLNLVILSWVVMVLFAVGEILRWTVFRRRQRVAGATTAQRDFADVSRTG